MMAVGYAIAGVLLGGALIVCAAFAVAAWLGVRAARPELLERGRRERGG
jgi:hypothetical protein